MNPQSEPKVHGFTWNLGPRGETLEPFSNITDLISREEMKELTNHYLKKIHPVYGVLDPKDLQQKIDTRWNDPTTVASYDSILCGVAALGSLFSGHKQHPNESELVQCAKEKLETTKTSKTTLLHHAGAWILRTIYLQSNQYSWDGKLNTCVKSWAISVSWPSPNYDRHRSSLG